MRKCQQCWARWLAHSPPWPVCLFVGHCREGCAMILGACMPTRMVELGLGVGEEEWGQRGVMWGSGHPRGARLLHHFAFHGGGVVNFHPALAPRRVPKSHFLGALLGLSEPPPDRGGQAERPRAGPHARAPATPPPRAQGRRGVTRGDKGPTPPPGASRLRCPGGARRISGLGTQGGPGSRLPLRAFSGEAREAGLGVCASDWERAEEREEKKEREKREEGGERWKKAPGPPSLPQGRGRSIAPPGSWRPWGCGGARGAAGTPPSPGSRLRGAKPFGSLPPLPSPFPPLPPPSLLPSFLLRACPGAGGGLSLQSAFTPADAGLPPAPDPPAPAASWPPPAPLGQVRQRCRPLRM